MYDAAIYGKVAVELNAIFNHLDLGIFHKIPKKLMKKIESIQDKEYVFKYDNTKSLQEQKILRETRELFSAIYLQYCCDSKTKRELLEKCKENDILEQEKYSYDNLFKKKEIIQEEDKIQKEEILPVVIKEESIIKIIFDKIKIFFKNFIKR